jgi:hypothetical protein
MLLHATSPGSVNKSACVRNPVWRLADLSDPMGHKKFVVTIQIVSIERQRGVLIHLANSGESMNFDDRAAI